MFIIYRFFMKEHLQKIAAIYAEIAKAAKDGDNDTLIAKMSEAAVAIDEATIAAEAKETEVATQSEEITKMSEEIKKWADLYVTAESFADVLEQMKEAMDMINGLTPLTKKFEELDARVVTVEQTSLNSRQDTTDPVPVNKSANPLASVASRFN